MPFFDQLISNPGAVAAIGQGATGAKKKLKSGLAGTMIGNAAGIKPESNDQFLSTDSGPKFKPIADPPPAPMIGAPGFAQNGVSSSTTSNFGPNVAGPSAPPPGTARAWSSQGGATPETPVHEFKVPVGPQPVRPENKPAPIGRAWSGFHSSGAGDSGSGGGGGSTAAANISSFYDSIGMPLNEVIGGAQRDEELAEHAWAQRESGENVTRGLQQEGLAQGIRSHEDNELVKRISELSTANLYNPTPEGSALIKHYMQQLTHGLSPAAAGTGQQQEGPAAGGTPTPKTTNNHPGAGGMAHAALHRGLPAMAAGASAALAPYLPAAWGGGPMTGIPATVAELGLGALGYWGANSLADKIDPGGAEAATEHPGASITGQTLGGFGGFGVGRNMRPKPAGTPEGGLSQKNPGANTGGPAGTIGAEAAPTPTTRPVRQMNPFGGGEMSPGETPIAPRSRQLTMGEMGAKASEPRTSAPTQTGTPGLPAPGTTQPGNAILAGGQEPPFAPKVQMSGDPQVDAALAAFKVQPGVHQAEQFSLPGMPEPQAPQQPSNVIPMPQQQQTQPAPGMQSTAIPQPRVVPMGVQPGGTNPRVPIATNPVQLPQQPSGVTTLNPALLDPQVLQRIIGDPRIGPAMVHDPAFYALIAKYMKTLEP